MSTIEFGGTFSQMWSFLSQRFILIFQWLDQITIGGLSLLKIGVGLTILTIVIAVVMPIVRTAPVDTSASITGARESAAREAQRAYDNSYSAYAARREKAEIWRENYDRGKR